MTKHALFATTQDRQGRRLTFRIGQPVGWDRAIQRWNRLDRKLWADRRKFRVRHDGRQLPVAHFEVRQVDQDGRGLGDDRHTLAFPVPFRNCRIER